MLQIESPLDESIMIRSYVESLASGMLIVPRVLPTEISDTLLSVPILIYELLLPESVRLPATRFNSLILVSNDVPSYL